MNPEHSDRASTSATGAETESAAVTPDHPGPADVSAESTAGVDHQNGSSALHRHWPLLAIILLYLVLGVWYLWALPPFEGPDEPQHFAYALWLADGRGLPPLGDEAFETDIEQEAGQPPLYYLLASVPARLIVTSDPTADYRPNPYFAAPLDREIPDNDNRAIHDSSEKRPFAGGWLALYSMRIISLLFGILLLIATYGLAGQVIPSKPAISAGSALLIALTPQVLFISTVVSNDIPAAAISACALWLLAILVRRGPRNSIAIATGLVAGLAILMKVSALALIVPIAAALLWLRMTKRWSSRSTVINGGLILLATALVAGWWFVRNAFISGSPFGTGTHDLTSWVITSPDELSSVFTRWQEVFRSFWIAIGWGSIRPDGWFYWIVFILVLAGIAGLAIFFARRWKESRLTSTTAAMVAILFLFFLTVVVVLEIWMRRVLAPHGRLLFPALAAISILIVVGWHQIHKRFALIGFGLMAFAAVSTPLLLIAPAFSAPSFLTAEEVAQHSPEMGWQFGANKNDSIAGLISVTPQLKSLSAGEVLPVEVCWRPSSQTESSHSVLLQAVGPENSVIAHRQSYPGQGFYLTETWSPGKPFCDTMHIQIGNDVPETLVYNLEIALVDELSNERMLVFDGDENLIEAPIVDRVRIAASSSTEGEDPREAGSDPIQLLEAGYQPVWTVDQPQKLTMSWTTVSPLDLDYQLFAHLRDQLSGEIVAQADGPPLDGWYPTSWWPTGEVVVDSRTFWLPPGIQAGQYDLVVGFYNLSTLEVFSGEHNLGSVTVED